MKVEKTVSKYLSGDYAQQNNISELEILTEAKNEEGEFGLKLVCKVKTNDEELNWTINPTSKNALIDQFGDDTAKWIGKFVPIDVALMANQKRAIFINAEKLKKKQEGVIA